MNDNSKRKFEQETYNDGGSDCNSEISFIDVDNSEVSVQNSHPVISQTELKMVKDMLKMAIDLLGDGYPTVSDIKIHKSFQPNCTQGDNFRRMYLAWNNVGVVTSREDVDSNIIQIHFQNSMGSNKDCLFHDINGYTLAAISNDGAIFANEFEGEEASNMDEQRWNIFYYSFPNSSIPNESFKARLSPKERAMAVAVGSGFISVATSSNLLRIFSSTGLPLRTIWLSGTPVCLCALNDQLAVVYQNQNNFDLKLDMYRTDWKVGMHYITEFAKNVPVPLFGTQILIWLGFSTDTMMLTILNSDGHLSMLNKTALGLSGWSWTPVLDLTTEVCTMFWPTTVQSDCLSFIPLDGNFVPRRNVGQQYPVPQQKKFHFPLLELDSDTKGSAKSMQQFVWRKLLFDHCLYVGLDSIIALRSMQQMHLDAELYDMSVITELESKIDLLLLNELQHAVQADRKGRQMDLIYSILGDRGLSTALIIGQRYDCSTVIEVTTSLIQQKQSFTTKANVDVSETAADLQTANDLKLTITQTDFTPVDKNKLSQRSMVVTAPPIAIVSNQKNPFASNVSNKGGKSRNLMDLIQEELTIKSNDSGKILSRAYTTKKFIPKQNLNTAGIKK
jgi:hypothetical protein